MERRRRKDNNSSNQTKSEIKPSKDDGRTLKKDIYGNRLTDEWLATKEADLPSALEQAHHFIKSGEMNDEHYYIMRWRHYEQTD